MIVNFCALGWRLGVKKEKQKKEEEEEVQFC